MADETAGNLESKRDEFNEAQLHMLEEISGRAPADVLQAAQDIKLIDRETRGAIEAALPKNHVLLFQNALAKGSGPKAFKRAFEAVYGKAFLEHKKNGVENPDGPVMQRLAEVLKFPIDRNVGLKGRSELIAAVRRLDIVASEVEHANATGHGISGLPKDSITAKIVKKIDEKISAKNKELAAERAKKAKATTDSDELAEKRADKRITELEAELNALREQRKDPVQYVMEEALPKGKKGADIKRLEREQHHAEHKQEKLVATYKYLDEGKGVDEIKEAVNGLTTLLGKAEPADAAGKTSEIFQDKKFRLEGEIKSLEQVKVSMPSGKQLEDLIRQRFDPALNEEVGKEFQEKMAEAFPEDPKDSEAKQAFHSEWSQFTKSNARDYTPEEAASVRLKIFQKLNPDIRSKLKAELAPTVRKNVEKEITDPYIQRGLRISRDATAKRKQLELLKNAETKARELHGKLKILIEHLEVADNAGVKFEKDGKPLDVPAVKKAFDAISLDSDAFDPRKLLTFCKKHLDHKDRTTSWLEKKALQASFPEFDEKLAEGEDKIKKTKKAVDDSKHEKEKSKDLTDAQAAKRIVGVLVGAQFPDISETDKAKLAGLVLAGDVAKLQTEEDYEQLANRASAEDLKTDQLSTINELAIRGNLIAFQYKEGDKVVQPFKGMKPEDFKNWEAIEKLFNIEKLNHKNGFFLLAALEIFDKVKDESGKVRSVQALRVEEKLKALLAKQLGVHERMDEAGISKIIDEAFKEQMKKVRPLVRAHFENYKDKGNEFKQHKVELLNLKYEELTDKLRNKKINQEIYEVKLKALIKEAVEADVDGQVKFSQDSVAAGYWNSSEAQWIKDKAHDAGVFVGKKAAAVGLGAPALIGLKGVWGATKLGASLGFHTVLFPFRAAKYPLIALAKPGIWAINLFRKTPWQPLPTIRAALSNDVGRVVGYGKQKATETLQGATKAVTETPVNMWKKVGWKSTKYADRTKNKYELRAERMKVLEEKAALTPVEVASSPFIDLAEYKEKIKALNEMVGAKTAFPAGHDVSAGHTEKAKEEKKEGHGKEAAGGHHS